MPKGGFNVITILFALIVKMEHRETELKQQLMATIREGLPRCKAFRHEDMFTSGIPDISVTWLNKTSWWEVKHGTPYFESKDIQERSLLQLAGAGLARYIMYYEKDFIKQTLIVHPKDLKGLIPEHRSMGFDHRWVVRMIRKYHERT